MSASDDLPRVSVITATYNRPDTLRLAIRSVLAQSFEKLEHWVIGDACDERTAKVIAEFDDPRLHYHNRPVNSGNQSEPNNDGLARSRGEFIAYLGHDDLWLPWHLAELVDELDRSGADIAHSLAAQYSDAGVHSSAGAPDLADVRRYQRCPPSTWLVRREWLERIGGWLDHRQLDHAVDANVLYRLLQAGAKLTYRPRLTLLKFPSRLLPGAYQRDATLQAEIWSQVVAAPEALERSVLTDLARRFAEHKCPELGWRGLCGRAARLLAASCVRSYGLERWPLPALRVRRYQALRGRILERRGLPAHHGQPDSRP